MGNSRPLEGIVMEETSEQDPASGLCREDYLNPEGNLDYRTILLSIQAALNEADPGLQLEPFPEYRIALDYSMVMAELSTELGKDLKPTSSDGARGLAMTVDTGNHDIVVLDALLIEVLFTPDMATAVHTIHHELGHVHDHTLRRKGWSRAIEQEQFSQLRSQLFPLAERLWSEYHAERRSAGSIRGQSLQAPLLIDFMPTFLNEVATYIARYRFHADIHLLLSEVSARVCRLLQFVGYILGDLAGTGSDPATLHPNLPALLSKPPLRSLWQSLREALDQLYQSHGNWESSAVFVPLEGILAQLFRDLGLEFSERQQGLWVDVPPRKGLG